MSFVYLATPYSRYEEGLHEAWIAACRAAAELIRAGIPVYSPIAHTHPIAIEGGLDPLDHGIWLPADKPMMDAACGLVVYMLPGAWDSYGIRQEMDAFAQKLKPIAFWEPGKPAPVDRIRAWL